jgi:hypothetical protein
VDSFLYKNLLRFSQENLNDTATINSTVMSLTVFGYNYKLDTGLLHPLVFEGIQSILLVNTIGSIQTDLFKHFNHLTDVEFAVDSVSNFYHRQGIELFSHFSLTTNVAVHVYTWTNNEQINCTRIQMRTFAFSLPFRP